MTPEDARDRAVDSLGQALAQVRHIRYHMRDQIPSFIYPVLDDYEGRIRTLMLEFGEVKLSK